MYSARCSSALSFIVGKLGRSSAHLESHRQAWVSEDTSHLSAPCGFLRIRWILKAIVLKGWCWQWLWVDLEHVGIMYTDLQRCWEVGGPAGTRASLVYRSLWVLSLKCCCTRSSESTLSPMWSISIFQLWAAGKVSTHFQPELCFWNVLSWSNSEPTL